MEEAAITPETAKALVARVGGKQTLTYRITPMPNALIPANSLGKQLSALHDIFREIGKQDGVNLKTLVTSISMDEDGTIAFGLCVMPVDADRKE